jgi:phage shock protein PspC (stress-responsive transcriptional regulator)
MVDPPPIREWFRAREGKVIAGVCRGLSHRFAIPVAAVRLGFLLTLLVGGWGLLAYIGLWIAMPLAPPAIPALPAYRPPGDDVAGAAAEPEGAKAPGASAPGPA